METRTSMTSIYPSSLSNIRMTIIIIQSNIFLLVSCSKLGLPFSTGQLIDDGPCIHILGSGNLRLPETLESGPVLYGHETGYMEISVPRFPSFVESISCLV